KLLKGKWKSIRDAYTRHLRLLREFRSGPAACAPADCVHAKELEFLQPLLALGCTENCWEDSTPNNVLDKDASSQQAGQASASEQASQASGDQARAYGEPIVDSSTFYLCDTCGRRGVHTTHLCSCTC
ncbi:hypothetical protein AB205_0183760, partial [Aquarana catesbeiana]